MERIDWLIAFILLRGDFPLTLWPWAAGLLAFVIFLPHIIWQIKHDWPTLEFIRNATLYKNYPVSPIEFLLGQILNMHPFNFPIWLAGLFYYLFSREGKQYRVLGLIYVVISILFVVQKAKVYYLAPAYPMLLAAGALVCEKFVYQRAWYWLKPTLVAFLVIGGILTAPYALPVFPVETFMKYARFLGIQTVKEERHEMGTLPQHFSDMFGWENMTAIVARVYHSLSPEEKANCGIYVQNYGEAGAIDFFGKAYHLPKAISGHNNYWLWGPQDYSGEIMIIVGGDIEDHKRVFNDVKQVDVITNEYAMPYENNLPVYLCRGLKQLMKEVWTQTKDFD